MQKKTASLLRQPLSIFIPSIQILSKHVVYLQTIIKLNILDIILEISVVPLLVDETIKLKGAQ
ncbi:FHA domain containing protein [Chryseobacterium sp. StRB126]|nr:FHA domain containing protein [Chryseobacterium sp. StRB126]